jgi:hypothetical protein
MELLTLVPGAAVTNPDQFSVNTSLSATNQAVNGHRGNQNNITVDGVGNLDNGSNGSLINNVSPDFMQEVKIQTSNFSAEYGRSTGAAFNLATKNGTNQFHGAAFEYFRNDALDARNVFSPTKTQLRYNDFGYDVGGPIIRNKVFFFVGEEWKRLRQQAAPARETLPTLAELNGNFAGTGQTIYQPGSKTPYPGNVIPTHAITPDVKAIANLYRSVIPLAAPLSNTPTSNNATFQTPNPLNYREDMARIDYHINDKNTLYGRWIDDYNSIYLGFGPSSTSAHIPITPEIRDRPGRSALLDETWVMSPNIVNETHVEASWNGQRYSNQGTMWQRSTQGFTFQRVFNTQGEYPNGIPDVSITSFAGAQGPSHTLISPTAEIEAGDTISIVHGQHTIRTGVMIIRDRKNQNGRSDYNGNISFNATGNPNTTGYTLADALLGNFNSYTEAQYDPIPLPITMPFNSSFLAAWATSPLRELIRSLKSSAMPPVTPRTIRTTTISTGCMGRSPTAQLTSSQEALCGACPDSKVSRFLFALRSAIGNSVESFIYSPGSLTTSSATQPSSLAAGKLTTSVARPCFLTRDRMAGLSLPPLLRRRKEGLATRATVTLGTLVCRNMTFPWPDSSTLRNE